MIEALAGFLGKALGSFAGPVWAYFVDKFRRPDVKLKKAPRNLLDHIKPTASPDHVRSILGPPHQISGENWAYRFADLIVQLEFWPGSGAKSVAVGLTGRSKQERFPIPGCSKPLGVLSIADAYEEISSIRYRNSLRHEDILVSGRIGPPGAWQAWTFGATRALAARALHESYFEWDHAREQLITPASMVLVNWVAVSSSDDEVWFDWSIG